MATLLRVFETKHGRIRGIVYNNMMYWHGNEIVKRLGYTDVRVLNDCVDADDTINIDVPEKEVPDKNTGTTLINNFGVQSLISAIPMNLGRVSGMVDVKLFKKELLNIENECRKNAISNEDKAVLKILHANTAEEKANSIVAYKNIIQDKMKTSNNNDGIQLQFEDTNNSAKEYNRKEIAKLLGVSPVKLSKYIKARDWVTESGNCTPFARNEKYVTKGQYYNIFTFTEKAFEEMKRDIDTINSFEDRRNSKPRKSIIGKTFGHLTVISEPDVKETLCKCDCGKIKLIKRCNLLDGKIKSCGCKKHNNK